MNKFKNMRALRKFCKKLPDTSHLMTEREFKSDSDGIAGVIFERLFGNEQNSRRGADLPNIKCDLKSTVNGKNMHLMGCSPDKTNGLMKNKRNTICFVDEGRGIIYSDDECTNWNIRTVESSFTEKFENLVFGYLKNIKKSISIRGIEVYEGLIWTEVLRLISQGTIQVHRDDTSYRFVCVNSYHFRECYKKIYKYGETPPRGKKSTNLSRKDKIDEIVRLATKKEIYKKSKGICYSERWSISRIIESIRMGEFHNDERYQRSEASTWEGFGRQLLETFLSKKDLSWVNKFHINEKGNKNYDVVDGQQRLIALALWFCNISNDGRDSSKSKLSQNFSVEFHSKNGKDYILDFGGFTWNDIISKSKKDPIINEFVESNMNKCLDVVRYIGYTNDEIACICGKINTSTHFNDQETRNMIGGVVSRVIRGLARPTAAFASKFFHPIYTFCKKKGKFLDIKNGRMNFEKTAAVDVLLNYSNFGPCAKDALDKFYRIKKESELDFLKAVNETHKQYDVILAGRKNALGNIVNTIDEAAKFILCGVIRLINIRCKYKNKKIKFVDCAKFVSTVLKINKTYVGDSSLALVKTSKKTGEKSRMGYDQVLNKGYKQKVHVEWIFNQWSGTIDEILAHPERFGIRVLNKKNSNTTAKSNYECTFEV